MTDRNPSLDHNRLTELLDSFDRLSIGVIGDVMLDRYIRGSAGRLSPEAPVPVVDIREESEHPGGAANVATNLAALGIDVHLFGVTGQDPAGRRLVELLVDEGIDAAGVVAEAGYGSTVKTRVIADGQHVVRADREPTGPPDPSTVDRLLERLASRIDRLDGLILQDYNKGTLQAATIERVVRLAEEHRVPTFVDPKRANFFAYRGVTLFKPNRREVEDALGCRLGTTEEALGAIDMLRDRLGASVVVITLGDRGMVVEAEATRPVHVPTRAIQVADVSGAGDTVIALLAAATAAGATPVEGVLLANAGAGIVCERVGTVAVTVDELRTVVDSREESHLAGSFITLGEPS